MFGEAEIRVLGNPVGDKGLGGERLEYLEFDIAKRYSGSVRWLGVRFECNGYMPEDFCSMRAKRMPSSFGRSGALSA